MNIFLIGVVFTNVLFHIWFYFRYKLKEVLGFGVYISPSKNIVTIRIIFLSFSNLMIFDELNVINQMARNMVHFYIVQAICGLVILLLVLVYHKKISLKNEILFYKSLLIACLTQCLIFASSHDATTLYITQNIIEFIVFYACLFIVFQNNKLTIIYITFIIFIFLSVTNSITPREPITLVAQHTLLAIGFNILFFMNYANNLYKNAVFIELSHLKNLFIKLIVLNNHNEIAFNSNENSLEIESIEKSWDDYKTQNKSDKMEDAFIQIIEKSSSNMFWREVENNNMNKYFVGVEIPEIYLKNLESKEIEVIESDTGLKRATNTVNITNTVKKTIDFINEIIENEKTLNKDILRQIANQLKLSISLESGDIWTDFLIEFEKKRPNFFSNLKEVNPSLTLNEMKYCALILSMYTIKEMAKMTHLSIRSIETTKYRIKKKLNLESSDDLYEYLLKI